MQRARWRALGLPCGLDEEAAEHKLNVPSKLHQPTGRSRTGTFWTRPPRHTLSRANVITRRPTKRFSWNMKRHRQADLRNTLVLHEPTPMAQTGSRSSFAKI